MQGGLEVAMFKIGATEQVTTEFEKLVALISSEYSSKELKEKLVMKNDKYFRNQFIKPAIEKA